MAKWHDDNRTKFEDMCLISAIEQNLAIDDKFSEHLKRLETTGLIRKIWYWEVTPAGEEFDRAASEECSAACSLETEPTQ